MSAMAKPKLKLDKVAEVATPLNVVKILGIHLLPLVYVNLQYRRELHKGCPEREPKTGLQQQQMCTEGLKPGYDQPICCISVVKRLVGNASALNHRSEGAILHAQQVGDAVILQPLAVMHHQHLHDQQPSECELKPMQIVTLTASFHFLLANAISGIGVTYLQPVCLETDGNLWHLQVLGILWYCGNIRIH